MTAIDSTSGRQGVRQSQGCPRIEANASHPISRCGARRRVDAFRIQFCHLPHEHSPRRWVGLVHGQQSSDAFQCHQIAPAYRLERMRSDRMANEAMLGWLLVSNQHLIPESPRTVDMWLYWGKIMHVLSRCMPDASPAELMNWSVDQWSWAVGNERATWAEMQPQERMFSKQPREVMRWFQEAPFTRVGRIPQESPDRLGVFLGWRAVEAALEAHPEWTTRDVLDMTDPQSVLRSYRP